MLKIRCALLVLMATSAFAQNANQAAVDTLTKDVAIAVFGKISQEKAQLKAQEIYARLLSCGDGCDPQTVIRTIGGWDAVGAKMQELSEVKNTARFITMSPEDANTAIRRQLTDFYARYKSDNNYGKPLSPAIQAQILAKIDQLLPPAVAPEPGSTQSGSPVVSGTAAANEMSIDPVALQLSQLERAESEKQKNQLWMILSGIVGLLVGAGAVYLLLYRAAQTELKALLSENNRLRNSLETAQRTKPGNEVNTIRVDYRQKAGVYDAIVAELGTDNPLTTIRQLKQQAVSSSLKPASVIRSGEPAIEPNLSSEPIQNPAETVPVPTPDPVPAPARSEVFYFPPPDPNGQFDLSQKSGSLSPESAYRFSVDAANASVASFRFEADPGRLARFLTYRNYMIEPACESENSYTTTHTRIAMRRNGQAVLENGVWRVKTKALIRYE